MRETRAVAAFRSTFYELRQQPIFRKRCKDRAGDGGRAGLSSARSTPSCPTSPAFTRPASKDRASDIAHDQGYPTSTW